jgi:hypothetical protein
MGDLVSVIAAFLAQRNFGTKEFFLVSLAEELRFQCRILLLQPWEKGCFRWRLRRS